MKSSFLENFKIERLQCLLTLDRFSGHFQNELGVSYCTLCVFSGVFHISKYFKLLGRVVVIFQHPVPGAAPVYLLGTKAFQPFP